MAATIITTAITHIMDSRRRIPAGTTLAIVKELRNGTVFAETTTGRMVTVGTHAYRTLGPE
jgi:hypothetical protein